MQVPPVSVRRVGRCKSASAADIQLHSRWHSRNCRHERVPVSSCSENAASKWSQKLATLRLFSADDADELMCTRHQRKSRSAAPCCMSYAPMSSFHTECHCVACCSCSPFDRRSGNCPAFTFPVEGTLSVRRALSLDSGLAVCQACSQQLSADRRDTVSANEDANLVQNYSAASDAVVIHKSSSVPACCSSQMRYYAAGISFDSLNDDTCQTRNTGSDSVSSGASALSADAKSPSSVSPAQSRMSPAVDYMNNQVSPIEYHNRFEVCTFAADVSECMLICIIVIIINYIILSFTFIDLQVCGFICYSLICNFIKSLNFCSIRSLLATCFFFRPVRACKKRRIKLCHSVFLVKLATSTVAYITTLVLSVFVSCCVMYNYVAYLQTVTRWFQEFCDEQKNLLLLQLLVGKLIWLWLYIK